MIFIRLLLNPLKGRELGGKKTGRQENWTMFHNITRRMKKVFKKICQFLTGSVYMYMINLEKQKKGRFQ